jgi:hypothetical protein
MYRQRLTASAALCSLVFASQASAATVTFTGAVVNTCVINISTPGTLGLAASGTTLSSEETGGLNSVMAIIATGSAPQIQFAAPQLTGPAGSIAAATHQIAYTSPGGAAQTYTASSSVYTMSRLLDTLTVKAKATNVDGFASGTYTITSVVTCQQ